MELTSVAHDIAWMIPHAIRRRRGLVYSDVSAAVIIAERKESHPEVVSQETAQEWVRHLGQPQA
jgi:hypothetical protein